MSAWPPSSTQILVALRKESVDRNAGPAVQHPGNAESLSARRAWIEISPQFWMKSRQRSLSARRAWIEIARRSWYLPRGMSLSARRAWIEMEKTPHQKLPQGRRSPQGERGMFLFLTVQGGFVHADIRFNFKNCYSKELSHKII